MYIGICEFMRVCVCLGVFELLLCMLLRTLSIINRLIYWAQSELEVYPTIVYVCVCVCGYCSELYLHQVA